MGGAEALRARAALGASGEHSLWAELQRQTKEKGLSAEGMQRIYSEFQGGGPK